MRLMAFGGDERMRGALLAAGQAGWETLHIEREEDIPAEMPNAQAVMLPWPRSFREEQLVGQKETLTRERVLELIPPRRAILAGGDVKEEELPQAVRIIRPERDEAFLRKNARLTAEGALATVMRVKKRALISETALVTGYGRIGQEMTARLCAMGMFVIVCARNENQMRLAHAAGAHPVPLAQIGKACGQADVIINTIPAHVLSAEVLEAMPRDTPIIELASAPYGLELKEAVRLGLQVCVESGLPGRYAPLDAGQALFDAMMSAMTKQEGMRDA